MHAYSAVELEGLVIVGTTLGPLLSEDPLQGRAVPLFEELVHVDALALGEEWPFAAGSDVVISFALMQQGLDDGLELMAEEYRRLFVGPGTKAVPPWGSVYTDRDGVIFGYSALTLQEWMDEHGIVGANENDHMPQDHIGSMFLLLAWLARERPELLDAYLSQHFLTWAPHFFEHMQREACQGFYRGLSQLAQASLAGMAQELEVHVVPTRFYR